MPKITASLHSENAELIGQHLTLRRWIQIISARIKGLKSVSHDNGKVGIHGYSFYLHQSVSETKKTLIVLLGWFSHLQNVQIKIK